ncbi:MAG TPA: type II secretion system F family protein [Candidatus Saccharimonadales bacterium]|nr:type II secretion system F family protein [Candidatus Saccharimonadales bacterium]
MADFSYTARTASGSIQKGTISGSDKEAVFTALRNRQLQPILVQPAASHASLSMNITLPGSSGVKPKELVVFTRQFSTMVSAGVPLLRSLTTLKDQSESPIFRQVLNQVAADVQSGSSLSDALAKHPKVFSQIYVNMVRAGEEGGILDKVLDRLAFQQEKDAALKGKIKSAMVYPAVIGVVMVIAMFILMTFIVPKIGGILANMGTQLPIYTRILLAVSNFMKQPTFLIGVVVVLPIVLIAFGRWKKTPRGRYLWDSFLLKIPVVKVIILKTAIARFSRIFASLMGAGVNIVQAMETTAGAIGNSVIEKELLECSKAIQAGSQLSIELEKSKHFPPIVAQMLAVGEETGKTDTVIIKVAEFYEEEVDAAVAALSSIIEPVMIIVLGGMVGLIAVSVFGPITQVSSSVGNDN